MSKSVERTGSLPEPEGSIACCSQRGSVIGRFVLRGICVAPASGLLVLEAAGKAGPTVAVTPAASSWNALPNGKDAACRARLSGVRRVSCAGGTAAAEDDLSSGRTSSSILL